MSPYARLVIVAAALALACAPAALDQTSAGLRAAGFAGGFAPAHAPAVEAPLHLTLFEDCHSAAGTRSRRPGGQPGFAAGPSVNLIVVVDSGDGEHIVKIWVIVIIACVALLAAAQANARNEATKTGTAADQAAIAKLQTDWTAGWNKHQAKDMAAVFAENGDMVNPMGRVAKGRLIADSKWACERARSGAPRAARWGD